MKHTLTLANAQQGHSALAGLWQHIKPALLAGHKLTLTVAPEKRNVDQNALLHATLQNIAERREWAGQRWDVEVWKRLLTAAWCRARGERVTLLPAIDGAGVDIVFRRTSQLSKSECAELIDYIQAWDATA